jgi:hypothetical protein
MTRQNRDSIECGMIFRDEYKQPWKVRAIAEDQSGVLLCRKDNTWRGLSMDGFLRRYECAEPYHIDDIHHDVNDVYSQYDEGKITSVEAKDLMAKIGNHIVKDVIV